MSVVNLMSNRQMRFYLVEHPSLNIIAIVLITVGWSWLRLKDMIYTKRTSVFDL